MMTASKAREQLRAIANNAPDDRVLIAYNAVVKHIPRHVDTYPDKAGVFCPACRHQLNIKQKYCDECGQAIEQT